MSRAVEEFFIFVIGPFNAGKKTFIQTICKTNVGILERQVGEDLLVGFYEGKLYLDEFVILFWANPGARRFDYLRLLANEKGGLGIIYLVDSAQPVTFREARSIFETFQAYSLLPCIVAANKQDKPDAVSTSDLRYILRIPDEIPVVPCVATDYDSVKQVLLALLEETLKSKILIDKS